MRIDTGPRAITWHAIAQRRTDGVRWERRHLTSRQDGETKAALRERAEHLTPDGWQLLVLPSSHLTAGMRALVNGVAPPRTNRPRTGTGGHGARVTDQLATGSVKLIIGKEFWRAIGSPRRVRLTATARGVLVTPAGPGEREPSTYAVSGPPGSVPACSPGKRVAAALGLRPGRYRATVRDGALLLTAVPDA